MLDNAGVKVFQWKLDATASIALMAPEQTLKALSLVESIFRRRVGFLTCSRYNAMGELLQDGGEDLAVPTFFRPGCTGSHGRRILRRGKISPNGLGPAAKCSAIAEPLPVF